MSAATTTALLQQTEIVDRLMATEYLVDVTVLAETPGDYDNTRARMRITSTARAGKVGVGVIVMRPKVVPVKANALGPLFGLSFQVVCLEDRLLNNREDGTYKDAFSVARAAAESLHLFCPDVRTTGMEVSVITQSNVPTGYRVSNAVAFDVTCYERAEIMDKVPTPTLSPDGGTSAISGVTATCSDATASLYYTTDGTYPSSINGTLVDGLIVLPGACTLKVGGCVTGKTASNVAVAEYT